MVETAHFSGVLQLIGEGTVANFDLYFKVLTICWSHHALSLAD